ncbi:MAG: molybdopterin-dependent oxidoreductase [Raoultibacter sp.]
MSERSTKIMGLVASGTLVVSAAPFVQATAFADPLASSDASRLSVTAIESTAPTTFAGSQQVTLKNVQGLFAWDQGVAADNATLAKSLYGSSAALCKPQGIESSSAPTATGTSGASTQAVGIEQIKVSGDIGHAFTASVEEFTKKSPVNKIMGCTCSGNPADGRASANAAVSGFKVAALIEEADPAEEANAITFVARDGYRVSLPLSYVTQRYSIIVTGVNGEQASEAVGCENQLWLGSTAARSFARDIVAIEITHEATPPAAPGAPVSANAPNVGVLAGSVLS